MRTVFAIVVAAVCSWTALAQEPIGIRSVIAKLNQARKNSNAKALSELFAPDGMLRVGATVVASGQDAIGDALDKRAAWSEVTAPVIGKVSVRLLSPDVALVDATQTQYGSLIVKQSDPITLLMKLDGNEWRIVSLWLSPPPK
jgi:uncharacterized protein (TIGR02246 family)